MATSTLVPAPRIDRAILIVRGCRVILDADLASMYGVSTRALVQAVKRNQSRFPKDFVIKLTREDLAILRSQSVISRSGHGGRRSAPYAFTEQGVAMLSSVLHSRRAIGVNIEIMRAFVRLRHMLHPTAVLARKLSALETRCDTRFSVVFQAIRELTASPRGPRRRIGFRA
jgi:hypothetical protein